MQYLKKKLMFHVQFSNLNGMILTRGIVFLIQSIEKKIRCSSCNFSNNILSMKVFRNN